MKQPAVIESERSEELRNELRKQGYRNLWDVRENLTRISYWTTGRGQAILVLEHAHLDSKSGAYQWTSWDIYRQLTSENSIAKTYAALQEFTLPHVPTARL